MRMRLRLNPASWNVAARVVCVSAACLLLSPVGAVAQEMTDQNIADAVEDELLFDPAVRANEIDISVTGNVVTLKGTVDNMLAKDRATRIAETVKGVQSVVNRMAVEPVDERSDYAIESGVRSALLADPATDSFEVNVAVEDGIVTLTGTVASWKERQLSARVAKGVRGVVGVNNQIDVEYKTARPDSEIKPEIEKALRWDVLVDHALIDVSVDDGAVTLSGTVGSAAEKRRARSDAWVAGVKSVDADELEVERWARDEDLRKDKYVTRSDNEIEQAVDSALAVDPRVWSFNVTVNVTAGRAILRGEVDNLKAKRAAAQVTRNTVGVTYVTNRIKVRPEDPLSDAEVAESVREALGRNPYVDRYEIVVSVVGGTAYLNGDVDSYYEKWQGDEAAAATNGVVEVRNNLDVDYGGPLAYDPYVDDDYPYEYEWYDYEPSYTFETDTAIEKDIRDELFWSPFVDADDITVIVDDGDATLTGRVESWSEYNEATEEAYEGGAVWVDNDLTVASD